MSSPVIYTRQENIDSDYSKYFVGGYSTPSSTTINHKSKFAFLYTTESNDLFLNTMPLYHEEKGTSGTILIFLSTPTEHTIMFGAEYYASSWKSFSFH